MSEQIAMVGERVQALTRVTERRFAGKNVHVHAAPGDVGIVHQVDGDWSTVTFERSGTTTDCHASEIRSFAFMGYADPRV